MYNLLFEYPTHRLPIVPVVDVRVNTIGIEAEVVRAAPRDVRGRPIVAVRAYVVHGRISAVIGCGEEHRVSVNL